MKQVTIIDQWDYRNFTPKVVMLSAREASELHTWKQTSFVMYVRRCSSMIFLNSLRLVQQINYMGKYKQGELGEL